MVYCTENPWTLIMGSSWSLTPYAVQKRCHGAGDQVSRHRPSRRRNVNAGYTFGGIPSWSGCGNSSPRQPKPHRLLPVHGRRRDFHHAGGLHRQVGVDPQMGQWGKAAQPALGFNFASVMNLNYVVMGILAGIVIVNVFKVPAWAEHGVRLSRLD